MYTPPMPGRPAFPNPSASNMQPLLARLVALARAQRAQQVQPGVGGGTAMPEENDMQPGRMVYSHENPQTVYEDVFPQRHFSAPTPQRPLAGGVQGAPPPEGPKNIYTDSMQPDVYGGGGVPQPGPAYGDEQHTQHLSRASNRDMLRNVARARQVAAAMRHLRRLRPQR